MTPEQKKIAITKQVNKIKKWAAYLSNNPPKTAKHALKSASKTYFMRIELYKLIYAPTIKENYKRGGLEMIHRQRIEYIEPHEKGFLNSLRHPVNNIVIKPKTPPTKEAN